MKRFTKNKKVLFGLATSLVLALAIGSFALGEAQTPTAPMTNETPSTATTNDDTCDFAVTGDASEYSFDSGSGVLTIHGTHTISMAGDVSITTQTTQRIYVDGEATITLNNVDIQATDGPALQIRDDADFNVTILLTSSQNNLETTKNDCAGLQKNGGSGTLTIEASGLITENLLIATGGDGGAGIGGGNGKNASNIIINDGSIEANGGSGGAGIGGGNGGNGSNITIAGGVIDATGGNFAAAIGGGQSGTGAGNSLNGDAIVNATSGDSNREALDNFTFSHGILFNRQGSDGTWADGEMKGNVTVSQRASIRANLTIEADQTLNLMSFDNTIDATLFNYGTINGIFQTNKARNSEIKTYVTCYKEDGTPYAEGGWQVYSISSTTERTYQNLPDPSSEITDFDGWYTKPDKQGGYRADENTDVFLNGHSLYIHHKAIPFDVNAGENGTDYQFDETNKVLKILSDKEMTITNKESFSSTDWRIVIDENVAGANLILNGVNIETNTGAAFEIPDNATFNVNILLADSSQNVFYSYSNPALQKNDDLDDVDLGSLGALTIGVPENDEGTGKLEATSEGGAGIGGYNNNGSKIKITGGEITATGMYTGIGGVAAGRYITIEGGIVKATGKIGAGIGGGPGGSGDHITITGGEVTAIGRYASAGIGGGYGANGDNIEITGGVIKAVGSALSMQGMMLSGAGIGGGGVGTASNNKLDGDAVVLAVGGGEDIDPSTGEPIEKAALDGFDNNLTKGIAFTGTGTAFDSLGKVTEIGWENGTLYGNSVKLTEDVTFPVDFTITSNAALIIGENASGKEAILLMESGKKLIVEGSLINDGIIDIPSENLLCTGSGTITTLLSYDPQGGSILPANDDNHIIYQDASGVKKYEKLPSATKDEFYFGGWYNEKEGQGTKVDATSNVLLNSHVLYANWTTEPEPTPTPPGPEPGPEPTPTPEPTPDPSVDPDGGSGSGSSSKTSDPFMGGMALALLGVATTGAVLVRKRK